MDLEEVWRDEARMRLRNDIVAIELSMSRVRKEIKRWSFGANMKDV